jgi:N-formylmaleamate deformylase
VSHPPFDERARSTEVTANGIRQHFLDYGGDGPALLIVPGITMPAACVEFLALPLAERHRVISVDPRGRGLSEQPASGYALRDYADDLAALIETLGLERPIVLGHSMGARIAAALTVFHPGLAGSVILADPPLTGPGRAPYPVPLDPYVDSLRKAKRGATADDMRPAFPTWSDEHLALRALWLGTCSEAAVVETYERFHTEDLYALLPEIRVPTLFVYGADSAVVPASALPELRALLPGAHFAAVDRAAHMIPWDNLDEFVAVILQFTGEQCQHPATTQPPRD